MGIKRFQTGDNSTIQFYEAERCYMVNPFKYYIQKYSAFAFEESQNSHYKELEEISFSKKLALLARLKAIAENEVRQKNLISMNFAIQTELAMLLTERKKKQQQKLIKEIKFSSDILYSLPLFAWEKYKMPYSFFAVDHMPKELDGKKAPNYFYKNDDGNFEFNGITDLTDVEMEIALQKRNRVISEFLGDEEHWLCFFRTMAGIRGTEHPHIGSPHVHFISSAWGINREAIEKQLSSYRYKVNAETIAFIPRDSINS